MPTTRRRNRKPNPLMKKAVSAVKSAATKGVKKYLSATNKAASKIQSVIGTSTAKRSSRSKRRR